MKSEFSTYLNMTYVKLARGAHFCLELSRFVQGRTIGQVIDDTAQDIEKLDAIATDAITGGHIGILDDANKLDNQIDQMIAKLDLYDIGANYLNN